jgi:23S rRNA pseudouridine1911/1915/1917 synthase
MTAEASREYHFTADQPGVRLDKYLAEHLEEVSRSQVQRLILDGQVTVNGRVEKAAFQLGHGDTVAVRIPQLAPSTLAAENIPVPIIYEDRDILVVDKPAGMTVHPAPGSPAHTLVNAVLSHLKDLPRDEQRPGIVHRLDKDTSGVMVIAKNPAAHSSLSAQFKQHSVSKVYLALVRGRLTPAQGVIEAPIGRDSADRKKMAVASESRGRPARTRYRVIRYLTGCTYLEAMPETGRTHQIRVHMAAIGHPVVGDAAYGARSPLLARQFLHAHRLGFAHPATGRPVEFTSPLPPDLDGALKALG